MKKKFTYVLLFVILICSIIACFSQSIIRRFSASINKRISKSIEISIPANYKIEYKDSHGGFHGDGVTLAF